MFVIDQAIRDSFVEAIVNKGKKYRFMMLIPSRKISNLTDVQLAVQNVYEAGVPFQTGKQAYKKSPYLEVVNHIGKRMYDYFNYNPNKDNCQDEFDLFHESLCDDFLNSIKPSRQNRGLPDLTYGNAQKLINMAFKYLSCYNDYLDYADLFSFCHMPIDSFVLYAFDHDFQIPDIKSSKSTDKKGKVHITAKYGKCPWTSFDKDTYKHLVEAYRDVLKDKKGNHSYLALDFYIWAGMLPWPTDGVNASPKNGFFFE